MEQKNWQAYKHNFVEKMLIVTKFTFFVQDAMVYKLYNSRARPNLPVGFSQVNLS